MGDPRISVVNERLKEIRNIIAVSSGKGGVGKSLTASILALALVKKGYNIGLFDLDFTSPSTHIILGIEGVQPREEKGIIPPKVHGLEYMSIVYYTSNYALPLRGEDVSNALIELLSITKWGKLDFLIIDMPPGIGDATLDIIRLIKNIGFLVVTTPSQLAFETVRKLVTLLKELNVRIIGVVENMKMNKSEFIQQQVKSLRVAVLGGISFDAKIEKSIGNTVSLLKTSFAKELEQTLEKLGF
ncbi:P-loop NTPase [Candidatus Bathyarchaeota archaeon]|nr:P-loop NTPase [Candidatus Bathyarchaeota archaeon]